MLKFWETKYIFFKRKSPLRIDLFLNHTRKQSQRGEKLEGQKFRQRNEGEKSEWWQKDKQMSEDHRVCPPCCLHLHFLIRFSVSIQISPRFSSSFFLPCCYFSTVPLFLLMFLSFHLQSTHLYSFFCFYSCLFLALRLFFSLHSCLEIIFFFVRINQSIRTSTQTYYN